MQENIIRQLIKVEQGRLKIAVAWEKEKKIPNPETSVIINSILKLDEKLNCAEEIKEIGKPKIDLSYNLDKYKN